MRYLADTVVFLWMIFQPEKIAKGALEIIENGKNTIYLSAVSSWEIAIKFSLGKLEFRQDPKALLTEMMARMGVESLPITHQHALETARLPFHHKDPFDRLLIAQAGIEKLPVVTPDAVFKKYGIDVVWKAGHPVAKPV